VLCPIGIRTAPNPDKSIWEGPIARCYKNRPSGHRLLLSIRQMCDSTRTLAIYTQTIYTQTINLNTQTTRKDQNVYVFSQPRGGGARAPGHGAKAAGGRRLDAEDIPRRHLRRVAARELLYRATGPLDPVSAALAVVAAGQAPGRDGTAAGEDGRGHGLAEGDAPQRAVAAHPLPRAAAARADAE
jgi:hypothetical protein